MFREDYIRELDRVGPDEGQLERLLERINSEEERGGKKRIFPTVLLAAALCGALAVTALAASPTLREALREALGSFEPYSQTIEGLSVVDQGIQVRVVSALSDGNVAQVYYEIQDLTGDRLDEYTQDDLIAPLPLNWGEEDGPRWVSAGSTAVGGLVQYDKEARTALMVTAVIGKGPPAEKLVLDVNLRVIRPGKRHESIKVDPAWIDPEPLKSLTLENGKSVLAPGQNPRSLDSEFFSLSSFGYGEDGTLHFLVRLKDGMDDSQWERSEVRYAGGYSRSDTAPYYPRTERYVQTTDYAGMTEEEMEAAAPETRFQVDGVTYYDCRTGITPADVGEGDVEWVGYANTWLDTRPSIPGEWRLEVPVEMVEKTSVDMTGSQTTIKGVTAQTLHLSVLGATLESDPNGSANTLGYPMTLYLSDGRVIPKIDSDGLFHAGRYAVNHWTFPEPVEPEQVAAVAIGMWYIPLENGVGQPGRWLAELPQPIN